MSDEGGEVGMLYYEWNIQLLLIFIY
jgi:hypothetical protein